MLRQFHIRLAYLMQIFCCEVEIIRFQKSSHILPFLKRAYLYSTIVLYNCQGQRLEVSNAAIRCHPTVRYHESINKLLFT